MNMQKGQVEHVIHLLSLQSWSFHQSSILFLYYDLTREAQAVFIACYDFPILKSHVLCYFPFAVQSSAV